MSNTLISVNPNLKNRYGHYFHFDERLREAILKHGHRIIIIASKFADDDIKDKEYCRCNLKEFRTYFPKILFFSLSSIIEYIKGCIRFCKDIDCNLDKSSKLIFFMYTGSIKCIPAFIFKAFFSGFKDKYVINLFYYHFAVGQYSKKPLNNFQSLLLRFLNIFLYIFNIRLCTDSARLNSKLNVNFDILPMFSTTSFNKKELSGKIYQNDYSRSKKMNVCFPAMARRGKGFDLTCQLISKIINNKDQRFHFLVRKVPHPDESSTTNLILPIESNVEVFKGVLSDDMYKNMFIRSDIVFIPYRKEEFYTRTSSVLLDAIVLKRPIIAPSDTWCGDIVEKFGFGSTFEDGNVDSMYQSLNEVCIKLRCYRKNLECKRNLFLRKNNIEEFMEFIFKYDY